MKVLVIGAEKIVGRALVQLLTSESTITAQQNTLDWYDYTQVLNFLSTHSPTQVVCLLGKSGGIAFNQQFPADLMLDNLLINLNVMRACLALGITKAVFLGSSCMYPKDIFTAMPETLLLNGQLESTSQSYAVAKLTCYQLTLAFNQQYGTNFICAIPNSIYGPHDNFDLGSAHVMGALINRFNQAHTNNATEIVLWGSGEQRREFIYVDDAAHALARILLEDVTAAQNPINIGCGDDVTIKELANIIAKTIGFRGEIRWDTTKPDGTKRKLLANAKLTSLGWQPQIDLAAGISQTNQWYVSTLKEEKNDQVCM